MGVRGYVDVGAVAAAARAPPQRPIASVTLANGPCVMPRARLQPPTGLGHSPWQIAADLIYVAYTHPPGRLTRVTGSRPGGCAERSGCQSGHLALFFGNLEDEPGWSSCCDHPAENLPMKFKGTFGDQFSGSLAGLTASRNAGGSYLRERVVPVNPSTPRQNTVRQIFGNLAKLWTTFLSQAQRDAWITYAANVTIIDRLGEAINVSGMNMYIRSNSPRQQNGLARVDDGPTLFNKGDFTLPVIDSVVAPATVTMSFEAADDWVNEDGAAMLVYSSRQQGVGIVFFKGPYQAIGTQLLGDAITPLTSPNIFTASQIGAVGNKMFFQISVTRADGRLSEHVRLESLIT